MSCFQVTDSKLWQTYAIVKSSRWFNGSEPHTQSPGAAVRGIMGERLEADLCHGKVLVLEAGVLGAGSGPAPSRCAVFRESSDPPWFWIIGHGATCPGDHQLSSSSNKYNKTFELYITIYKTFSYRLTPSSPQPIIQVEETGTQR